MNETLKISGGAEANLNAIEYGSNYLDGTVLVPPSEKGQVVYLTVQVVEDTLIHQWLYSY
jgi:hypothetical protein